MRFELTIFFVSIFLLHNCENKKTNIPYTEYVIYNAFFNSITENEDFKVDSVSIAILDSTSIRDNLSLNNERIISKLREEWGFELSGDLIDDFNTKNATKHFIEDYFKAELRYQIIATDKYLEIFKNSYPWENLEEEYPKIKSFLTFSRIGLNTQKDKALLFVSISCGPLCGSTWFFYLEKVDNKWELANEQMLTIR